MQTTYRAKTLLTKENLSNLDKFCKLYNKLERKLFVDLIVKKKAVNELKKLYIEKYNLSSRVFNALKIGIQGKVDSTLVLNKDLIDKLEKQIEKDKKYLKIHEKVRKDKTRQIGSKVLNKLWHSEKRVIKNNKKLLALKEAEKTGIPSICFGTNKLFNQQFLINTNNNKTQFKKISEWSKAWKQARNKTFAIVGSKDETAGNSTCQLSYVKDNVFQIKLNLKTSVEEFSIELDNATAVNYLKLVLENNKSKDKNLWQAVSFRFYKDWKKKTYDVFISINKSLIQPKVTTFKQLGRVGVDINYNHLAVSEIDRFGNLLNSFNVPYDLKDKTTEQSNNILSLVVKKLTNYALEVAKPIVIEDLDFKGKKKSLKSGVKKNYNVMLSSFAYNKIIQLIKSRALDKGIELFEINPAFTSVIGRLKYQKRYRLGIHQAASLVIARRGFCCKERAISKKRSKEYSFDLPVRNSQSNEFSYWKEVVKQEKASMNNRKKSEKTKTLTVKQSVTVCDIKPFADFPAMDSIIQLTEQIYYNE